jgi:hypothetical protein
MFHMLIPGRFGLCYLLLVGTLVGAGFCQEGPNPPAQPAPQLQIAFDSAPSATVGELYHFRLLAEGGTPPLTWSLDKGELPPGLDLEAGGAISGKPSVAGEFRFTLRVTDSGKPAQSQSREFTITVVPPLEIKWTHEPQLQDDGIYGAVKVSNASGDDNDLTVIIVAVNQIGKAFALGYQRLTLAKSSSQEIPFGASLPIGGYIVHADAIAEIPSKNVIRRTRLHTTAPLIKSQ